MSSMRTADNPLGRTPIDTINDALEAAASLGRRVSALHDALLGAYDLPTEVGSSNGQVIRSGLLNDVQQHGSRVRTMISDANSAMTRIEEALGVTPMGLTSATRGGVAVGGARPG